ncbi:uncharacterized protein LOC131218308 isoform X1 [Magnolia sinica]|uniref:uncharacterized protein LOC131218308 isoform X1 n=1 Tax=Magnolia sinica TaxID=86752 RepID=UPI00265A7C7E|nr:uncharacterized protein LOC131218308 isoform X1 [Magnolia sinica]
MVIIHINLTWKLTKRDEALVQSKSAIEKETMTKKRRQLIDKQPDGSSGGYSGGIRDLETQLKLYDVERNKRANSTLRSCSISSQGLVSFLNTFQVYWNKR